MVIPGTPTLLTNAIGSFLIFITVAIGFAQGRQLLLTDGRKAASLPSAGLPSPAALVRINSATTQTPTPQRANTSYKYRTFYTPRGMRNKGGVIFNSSTSVYISWVGNFNNSRRQLLKNFITSLNPQADARVTLDDWWNTSSIYFGGSFPSTAKVPSQGWVSYNVSVGGEVNVTTQNLTAWGITQTAFTQGNVWTIVSKSMAAAKWPTNPYGAYFVFSNESYSQGSSCATYCGWHGFNTTNNVKIVYGWVGALTCTVCWPLGAKNVPIIPATQDQKMLAAINTFAHVLAGIVTDPFLEGWFTDDFDHLESGDVCVWVFSNVPPFYPIGTWNNTLGVNNTPYLVQMVWNPQQGQCSMGMPTQLVK